MRPGWLILLHWVLLAGLTGCGQGTSASDGAIVEDGDGAISTDDGATLPDDGSVADDGNGADDGGVDDGDAEPDPLVDCENIYQVPGQTGFYEDNPTYEDSRDNTASWTFSTPGEQGMDGTLLDSAASELEGLPYMWSFLVVRNDTIVLERYFNGSGPQDSNNVHSASKSILSTLTGIAIEKNFIDGVDQPICEILTEYFPGDDPRKEDITVEHLLTMSAGFAWAEDQTEYQIEQEEDWVRAILELDLYTTPGEVFCYCTGQSHLLSAVITRATGMSTCEFAHRHLLEPIGITAEHWGRDPQAVYSGGCNLYLTARELARFGRLILHQGEQLVPADWIFELLTARFEAGGDYDYGYFWWLTQMAGHPVHIAWGYGGQMLYLIPDLSLAVVFTTNTRDYFEEFDGEQIVRQYVIPSASP